MPNPDWSELPAPRRERLEERQEMLRLYVEEGLTFAEIGSRYDKSHQAVSRRLKPLLTPELTQARLEAREQKQWGQLPHSQFLDLITQGVTRDEIKGRLNISESQLRRLLASLDEATRLRWKRDLKHGPVPYSVDFIKACLKKAAAINGGKIGITSYEQLRKHQPGWPSAHLLVAKSGWNWWLEQAGVPTNPRPSHLGLPTFSDEDCCEALEHVSEQLGGRLPSSNEYEKKRRPSDPTAIALRHRSKQQSWVKALEELLPERFGQVTP